MTTRTTSVVCFGVFLLPVNYYVATFCLYLGHWFSHLPWSPLRNHHVLSHHRLYPHSSDCLTTSFHMATGEHDSTKALLPWLLPPVALYGLMLPPVLAVVSTLELALATAVITWIHVQFHLIASPLARWEWFLIARDRHGVHHDWDVNFAVADHIWDRAFGSFVEAPTDLLSRRGRWARRRRTVGTLEEDREREAKPC